ncbi:hypothetical protein PFLA_a4273 [Pseudoalteromonas flavipulchra NCIMB 2033 = ATCC BAA-314]|nr:hypothetical protein [Pseudoalteromonas flavipulchra NCIMB 2033 = ATCC BAA-314]
MSHSPLFQVMLALQNNDDGQLSLPDLNLSIVEAREGESAKYDLTLNVVESEDGLGLGWGYNTAYRVLGSFPCASWRRTQGNS